MKMQSQRGFTLIELLVVIAIIGVLASVVLASLNTARDKADDARRTNDIRQLRLAIELYKNDNNGNPPDTGGIPYCLGAPTCWGNGGEAAVENAALNAALAPYIASIPGDPDVNRLYNAYVYRSPGMYWLPNPINFVWGGDDSYSIAWKPGIPDENSPTTEQCEAMGGVYAGWDQPDGPNITHCPNGGSCRQCGVLIE